MASESIVHEAFVMGYWLRPIRAGGIIVNKRLIGTLLITRTCIVDDKQFLGFITSRS